MGERIRQQALRCQIHYLPDRHVSQKLTQAYRYLVAPALPPSAPAASRLLTLSQDEKSCRHLR